MLYLKNTINKKKQWREMKAYVGKNRLSIIMGYRALG